MFLGSCPTDSEEVPKKLNDQGGEEEGQFCQSTIIPHLARQKVKETPRNGFILLIKGRVRLNKIYIGYGYLILWGKWAPTKSVRGAGVVLEIYLFLNKPLQDYLQNADFLPSRWNVVS